MSQQWVLHICGTRGSRPVCGKEYLEFGGATTCYILKSGEHALILDCGSGLTTAGDILKDCKKIDIFLTHMHYDHILGLLGWSVIPKDADVHIFSTFHLWFGENTIDEFFRPPFWPIIPSIGTCISINSPGTVILSDGVKVTCHPSGHPNEANILRVDADDKSMCTLCDYEHGVEIPEEITNGCTLMLYDGMYTNEEYPSHKGWGHSCWEEGGKLAAERNIDQLLITHHDPQRTDQELELIEANAQKIYPNLRFARMGETVTL